MPQTIKSLIIDDDQFIINLLMDKLAQFVPEVEILSTAGSGTKGIEIIDRYQPDLIFLDVEMDDMTGFEMLSQLDNISFQTIFITSYTHYAIKAIRFNALDYLVKPIDLGELKQAIQRYKVSLKDNASKEKLTQALDNMKKSIHDQVLTLQTQEGEIKIPLKEIIQIEGERNYSTIFLKSKKKVLATKALGSLEEILGDKGFFRCHKSHLVNAYHIQSIERGVTVLLSNETKLPIARRKKSAFIEWKDNFKF